MDTRTVMTFAGLIVATSLLGCAGGPPRVAGYQPGTFYFDWNEKDRVNSDSKVAFAKQFEERVQVLTTQLMEPVFLNAIRRSNVQSRRIQLSEILERDRRWQLSDDDAIVAELTDAACGEALQRFMQSFDGFAEIFVTDVRGVTICVSNKTTDYYQADEDWWQDAFRSRVPLNGHLEYDESAGVAAVPAYIPIHEPASGQIIGVAKALLSDRVRPRS